MLREVQGKSSRPGRRRQEKVKLRQWLVLHYCGKDSTMKDEQVEFGD